MPLRHRRSIIVAAVIGGVIVGALVALVVWNSTTATDDPAVAISPPRVTSTATPSTEPTAPAPAAMSPDVFAAYVTKNVADITKDLNDLDTALATSNVLRIASNDEEIEYGLRQLKAAGPPATAATDWQISVQVIELRVVALRSDITKKDYATATSDVAVIRTELVNTLAIAARG